jgi:hypothetical protein
MRGDIKMKSDQGVPGKSHIDESVEISKQTLPGEDRSPEKRVTSSKEWRKTYLRASFFFIGVSQQMIS